MTTRATEIDRLREAFHVGGEFLDHRHVADELL
jgi:hypothetical protein